MTVSPAMSPRERKLRNLRPNTSWKKGVSANPKGRPKLTATDRAERLAIQAAAAELQTGIVEAATWAPAIINELATRALKPNAPLDVLLACGDRITVMASRLAELEVERLRAQQQPAGATVNVLAAFPSLAEIDARIAALRALPHVDAKPER